MFVLLVLFITRNLQKTFNQFVIEQGYEPSTEVISSELTQATSWDAKHLKS